jgi:hypothetical protein
VFLKAFASYRGLAQPVFSDAERLLVQSTGTAEQALSDLADRLDKNDINGALQFFTASPKNTEFLTHLVPIQRARFVDLLRGCRVLPGCIPVPPQRLPCWFSLLPATSGDHRLRQAPARLQSHSKTSRRPRVRVLPSWVRSCAQSTRVYGGPSLRPKDPQLAVRKAFRPRSVRSAIEQWIQ